VGARDALGLGVRARLHSCGSRLQPGGIDRIRPLLLTTPLADVYVQQAALLGHEGQAPGCRIRDVGATAFFGAHVGATALRNPCKLRGMPKTLTDHMRVFVAGEVSVMSLSYAAQAERVDRATANRILAVIDGWDPGAGAMRELRARVQNLI